MAKHSIKSHAKKLSTNAGRLSIVLAVLLIAFVAVLATSRPQSSLGACTAPPVDRGTATTTITIPSAGNYKVWSRIMAPTTANNSFFLNVDDTQCGIIVGDQAISANTWTWVDYRDATTSNKIVLSLSAGTHTISLVGREDDVKVDRLLFLSDQQCVPAGTGDNCATAGDTAAPTVSFTAPANNATVSGVVTVTANAADNTAVTKVELLVDGQVIGNDTSSPWSISWDSSTASAGNHTLQLKAYDAAGNVGTSSNRTVTVSNSVTTTPVYRLANYLTQERLFTTSTKEKDDAVNLYPGWIYEGVAFKSVPSGTANSIPVYRLANYLTQERLFTTSSTERDNAVKLYPGWVYEGVAFHAYPASYSNAGPQPVYRLANYLTQERLFTTSSTERDNAVKLYPGWVYEGVAFKATP